MNACLDCECLSRTRCIPFLKNPKAETLRNSQKAETFSPKSQKTRDAHLITQNPEILPKLPKRLSWYNHGPVSFKINVIVGTKAKPSSIFTLVI